MTLPVAVLAALTASAAAALTPSHGYAASFASGRPIAAAVVRDGAHQDLQFPGMEACMKVGHRSFLSFAFSSLQFAPDMRAIGGTCVRITNALAS